MCSKTNSRILPTIVGLSLTLAILSGCTANHEVSSSSTGLNDIAAPPKTLTASSQESSTPEIGLSSPTLGAQKVVVIVANFSDSVASDPSPAINDPQIIATMDGLQEFVKVGSFGKTWLTGVTNPSAPMDVIGPFTLSESSQSCGLYAYGDALNLARSAGYNVSQYDRVLLLTTSSNCPSQGGISFIGKLGLYDGVNSFSSSISQFDGLYHFNSVVVNHEFGHSLGLYHSHDSTGYEYGDFYDIMGNYWSDGQFNPFQKERLGWWGQAGSNSGDAPWMNEITSNGTFSVEGYSVSSANGMKALKILRQADPLLGDQYIYVQYHVLLGTDTTPSEGVLIHFADMLDPNSSQWFHFNGSTDGSTDGVMHPGDTFTDAVSGVSITLNSMDGTSAVISVANLGAQTTNPKPPPVATPIPIPDPTPAPTATPNPTVGSTENYAHCANENEFCAFDGTQTVRYGAGASYVTMQATGGVSCSNTTFGDPAYGIVKSCDIVTVQAGQTPAWVTCADENGVCQLSGTNTVRYGSGSTFVEQVFTGAVSCSNLIFGDPTPGIVKLCQVQN